MPVVNLSEDTHNIHLKGIMTMANNSQIIRVHSTVAMTEVVAQLVMKGLTFEVSPDHDITDDSWIIRLTGGF